MSILIYVKIDNWGLYKHKSAFKFPIAELNIVYYFFDLLFPEYVERFFEADFLYFYLDVRAKVSRERVDERTLFLLPSLLLLLRNWVHLALGLFMQQKHRLAFFIIIEILIRKISNLNDVLAL